MIAADELRAERLMREPTEAELDAAVGELVAHMREQLRREMDDGDEVVKAACRERLRARMALCESPDSPLS